ncbi:MAG: hypothetical protein D6722_20175, partial [Bacteroidetes bacterium]
MRPRLKISPLISLQDARSSAAVGFDLIGFSLARGSDRKLSPATAWNMVQWLSGPDIVLEMNQASLSELQELDQQFAYQYVSLPLAEWNGTLPSGLPGLILRGDESQDPETLEAIASAAAAIQLPLFFELSLSGPDSAAPFLSLLPQSFLHFPDPAAAVQALQDAQWVPYGFSLGPEWEEEPGVLDYER